MIGEFFGEHNILEYKSLADHGFNEYAVFQTLAYACYYCDRYQTSDVTEELDGETFRWLSVLTDRLTEEKARDVVRTAHGMAGNEDRRLAEAVVWAINSANYEVFEKIRNGDEAMAKTLFDLMRPEIEAYTEEKVREAEEKAEKKVRETAVYLLKIGKLTDEEIAASSPSLTVEEVIRLKESL